MIDNQKWYSSISNGTALVKTNPNFSVRKEKILIVVFPRKLPGWSLTFHLSHPKRTVLWWLVAKAIFRQLKKSERDILRLIGVQSPDQVFLLVKFILSDEFTENERPRREQVLRRIQRVFSSFPQLSENSLRSFHPSIDVHKVWTNRKRLKPVRFVGVGYNDHGHLSSLPSWKDQILYEEDPEINDMYTSDLYDSLLRDLRLVP